VRLLCAIRARQTFQVPALLEIELRGLGRDLLPRPASTSGNACLMTGRLGRFTHLWDKDRWSLTLAPHGLVQLPSGDQGGTEGRVHVFEAKTPSADP